MTASMGQQPSHYCGRYTCHGEDIQQMMEGDHWLEGSIISVLAEKMFTMHGGPQHAAAWHLSPLVLKTAKELLENSKDREAIVVSRQQLKNYLTKVNNLNLDLVTLRSRSSFLAVSFQNLKQISDLG
jgi:hypothetical protein